MQDEACRPVLTIANRGVVEFDWMPTREHALAAIHHMQQVADAHEEVEILSAIIQCIVTFIV